MGKKEQPDVSSANITSSVESPEKKKAAHVDSGVT